jgi:putative membrane protein
MWHMGDGWGWWMVFGWIWMVAFWGLIVWAVVTVISRLGGQPRRSEGTRTSLEILEERYARGEISHEEFEERRRRLQTHT